jgi:exonuclease SbcD
VDALLIAGDLYDGANTSMKTAAFLAAELRRLPNDITTFLIKGNHDAQSGITSRLDLPTNVKTFDGRGQVHNIESLDGDAVSVHGVSFADSHVSESLLPKYKAPIPDVINVGLMHTSLDGSPDHDPYAPVRAHDLDQHGFDYWALGHIHKRTVHQQSATIVMPGIPQGRHINENDARSVTLANIAASGEVTLEERYLAVATFLRVIIEAGEAETLDDLRNALEAAFRQQRADAYVDHLILRVRIAGESLAAWRFQRDADLVRETAQQAASNFAGVWIESVEIALKAPADDAAGAGATVELADDFTAVLATSEFAEEAAALIADIARRLPAETRDAFGADAEAIAVTAKDIAGQGAIEALARLADPEAMS